jgi:ornithine cyclodeaminase/alanine dehydrogenase-like protein (mu-crystallin family)
LVEANADEPSLVQEREDATMRKEPWKYKSILSVLDMDEEKMRRYTSWLRQNYDAISVVILNTINDLSQCEEDLLSQATRIERDLLAMRESLEAGYHLNASGVLQRGPIELDMLAQRRVLLIESLKRLVYITKNVGV